MSSDAAALVLRLAGPLQAWGAASQFNRRETAAEPTKSGVLGLLAAAEGRRRHDPIEDLLGLTLGVRTDQPGSLMRDYHTVSDYRGRPLLSAAVSAKGIQKPTSPAKHTHVTQRFYLQDAVFVVVVSGPADVVSGLREALRRPAFPLALGRRSCVPTQPLVLEAGDETAAHPDHAGLWLGQPDDVLAAVAWQASAGRRRTLERQGLGAIIELPTTVDDANGTDVRVDVPVSFDPKRRGVTSRRVRQGWARVATGLADDVDGYHDPFALLGW